MVNNVNVNKLLISNWIFFSNFIWKHYKIDIIIKKWYKYEALVFN